MLVFGLCSLLERGWIVPVGDAIPDRREAALRGTHSQAALGNDRGRQGAGVWLGVGIWYNLFYGCSAEKCFVGGEVPDGRGPGAVGVRMRHACFA